MISSPRARGCKYRSRVRGPSLRSLVFRSNQSRALLRSFVWRFLPAELNEFHLSNQSRPLPLQLAHSLRRCVSHCSPVQVERIVLAAPSLAIQDNYMQWSFLADGPGWGTVEGPRRRHAEGGRSFTESCTSAAFSSFVRSFSRSVGTGTCRTISLTCARARRRCEGGRGTAVHMRNLLREVE